MSENLSNPKPSKNYAINLIASDFSGQFDEVAAVNVVGGLFASLSE